MNKVMLTAWLITPVLAVGGLWMTIDRDAARKNRAMMSAKAGAHIEQPKPASPSNNPSAAGKTAEAELSSPDLIEQGFVIVVKDKSGKASTQEPIHIASSWNGWNPADASFKLSPRSDLRWQIIMKKGKIDGPIEFKFTRGNSDSWECNADLSGRSNRTLPKIDLSKLAKGEQPVFEFEVEAWEDMRPNAAARPDLDPYFKLPTEGLTGTLRRLQVSGGEQPFGVRDVMVWLPPGYEKPENAKRQYPVLYMQDGQNVFLKMPTTPDEWGADETATRLINEGKVEPMIIVGVPHAGKARATEYLPIELLEGVPARGKQYASWLVGEVMPRVERAFRVKPGAENTAVGGSSFGAIISLYVAQQYPEKVGKVLLESMSTNFKDGAILNFFAEQKNWPRTISFAMGGKERGEASEHDAVNKAMVEATALFESMAREKMLSGGKDGDKPALRVVVDEKGQHTESAWKNRFGAALEFLFPPQVNKGEKGEKSGKDR